MANYNDLEIDFNSAFAQDGPLASIDVDAYKKGWINVVGGINGIPTAQQFNAIMNHQENKTNYAYLYFKDQLTKKLSLSERDEKIEGSLANKIAENKKNIEELQGREIDITVDDRLSETSTNPIQNKTITQKISAVEEQIDNIETSIENANTNTSDIDTRLKTAETKLAGIASGATKNVIDTAMSSTSTNAVQNKVVKQYVDDRVGNLKFSVVNNILTVTY